MNPDLGSVLGSIWIRIQEASANADPENVFSCCLLFLDQDEFNLFFQIDQGKTTSPARNWTNSAPQTDATTFALSSNSILLLCVAVLRVLLRVDVPALPLLPQPQLRQRPGPRHHLRIQVQKDKTKKNLLFLNSATRVSILLVFLIFPRSGSLWSFYNLLRHQ